MFHISKKNIGVEKQHRNLVSSNENVQLLFVKCTRLQLKRDEKHIEQKREKKLNKEFMISRINEFWHWYCWPFKMQHHLPLLATASVF